MNLCKKQLHDTDLAGFTPDGVCRECKREYARYYVAQRKADISRKTTGLFSTRESERAGLTNQILDLAAAIEREPRRWVRDELCVELAALRGRMLNLSPDPPAKPVGTLINRR